jgi:hypothetical protein
MQNEIKHLVYKLNTIKLNLQNTKIKNKIYFNKIIYYYYLRNLYNKLTGITKNNIRKNKLKKQLTTTTIKIKKLLVLRKQLQKNKRKIIKRPSLKKYFKYIKRISNYKQNKKYQLIFKNRYFQFIRKLSPKIIPQIEKDINIKNIYSTNLKNNLKELSKNIDLKKIYNKYFLYNQNSLIIQKPVQISLITKIKKKNFFITVLKQNLTKLRTCNKGPFPRDLRRNIQSTKLVIIQAFKFLKLFYKKVKFNKKLILQINSTKKIKKKIFLTFLKVAKAYKFKIQRVLIFSKKPHGGCRLSKKKRK